MNKSELIATLKDELEKDLAAVKEAARVTYEAATHEESKAENEYDTRGLEASYLAGAQAKRAAQIEELLFHFKNIEIQSFDDSKPIGPTALVEVELNGKRSFVLIVASAGGLVLNHRGQMVQTVTPASPLGEALLGLKAGDTAWVETGNKAREYEILSVQ